MSDNNRHDEVVQIIKGLGPWGRITNDAWCVKLNNTTTAEIRDVIVTRYTINENERLMIVDITDSSWASFFLHRDVADWLKRR